MKNFLKGISQMVERIKKLVTLLPIEIETYKDDRCSVNCPYYDCTGISCTLYKEVLTENPPGYGEPEITWHRVNNCLDAFGVGDERTCSDCSMFRMDIASGNFYCLDSLRNKLREDTPACHKYKIQK